jgi:hypothetical protein
METDEAMACCEEEISVRTSQTRKRVKSHTIHSDKDRSRETRLWEELYPMHSVVIEHDSLNYPAPLHRLTPLYWRNGHGSIAVGLSINRGTMEMRE